MKSNKVARIFFTALILFVFGKAQGKFKNMKTHLDNYEVSKITELKRPLEFKFDSIENRKRSIEIKAFGKKFDMDLAVYFPRTDIEITYFSNVSNQTTSFLDLRTQLYQGQVRHAKGSYVIGSFPKKNLFRGYIITDEVYCVEPIYESASVIVYKFSDVISPGCTKKAEGKGRDCTKTKYFMPWKASHLQKSLKNLSYTWLYDKLLKLYNRSDADETKKQVFGKQVLDLIGKVNSFEEKINTEGKGDKHVKRNDTATSHHHHPRRDHKKKNDTDKEFHHSVSNSKNGTDDDDDDDNDDDDDDNKIKAEMDHFSIKQTSRQKKDFYSKTYATDELKNGTDEHEKSDHFKSPSLLKSNEGSDFISITSTPSITNRTDSFIKNSSFFESLEMKDEFSYAATNSKLRDEQVKKGDKRSVKSQSRKKVKVSERPLHFECNVQFVFDQKLQEKFEGQPKDVVKDIIVQTTLVNKILGKVALRRKSHPFYLHLEVKGIVIYGENIESSLHSGADLEYFNKRHERLGDSCFIIGLANEYLKSGQFSNGYIPHGGGGACSKSGNIIIVSHGDYENPLPMALYFSALMRGITRGLGANDEDEKCAEGHFPDPMKVLQDYLLAKVITPGKEYSIFTECNVKDIEIALNNTECLLQTNEPWCGNGVIDKGEECDCGPDYICGDIDKCCTPHNHWGGHSTTDRGCKLVKEAKCSSSQPCCDYACNVIKEKEKKICHFSHDTCEVERCDGKSAECPTSATQTDGKVCKRSQPELLLCKQRKCGQGLCSGSKLASCTCSPKTGKECVYCCLKDGKCQAAVSELHLLKENKDYPLVDGTDCDGGKCSKGNCSGKARQHQEIDVQEPPQLPAFEDGVIITTPYSIPCLIFFLSTLHFLTRCLI